MWCGREYFPIKETAAISPFPPICFCWPVEKLFVGSMYIYVCGLFIATKIWFNAEANIDRTCCVALYLEGDASKRTVRERFGSHGYDGYIMCRHLALTITSNINQYTRPERIIYIRYLPPMIITPSRLRTTGYGCQSCLWIAKHGKTFPMTDCE